MPGKITEINEKERKHCQNLLFGFWKKYIPHLAMLLWPIHLRVT